MKAWGYLTADFSSQAEWSLSKKVQTMVLFLCGSPVATPHLGPHPCQPSKAGSWPGQKLELMAEERG